MEQIARCFKIEGEILSVDSYKNGLVNKTYLVITDQKKYLLQRINKFVFKNPTLVMDNIEKVTTHLLAKQKETLHIIKTLDGASFYYNEKQKEYYRVYAFFENYEVKENPNFHDCLEIGKIIGEFQNDLADFKQNELNITIKHFHSPFRRLKKLKKVFKKANGQKQKEVVSYYKKLLPYKKLFQKFESNSFPRRIVHSDTKYNNILFDGTKAVCLIDLDTVMRGVSLFDFGDAARSCCSTLKEDDDDFLNVDFSKEKFACFMVGYLSQMISSLSREEIELLISSVDVVILELTIRFLTDYLEGNVYFKINYEKHNLVRVQNGICLHEKFKKSSKVYQKIVKNIIKRLCFS